MIRFHPTDIEGLHQVSPQASSDQRGKFVKLVQRSTFRGAGLESEFPEIYFSTSYRDVVRGMHFQLPPHAHNKLVFCLEGKVLDVVVDLRRAERTYRAVQSFTLNSEQCDGLYIPVGIAHGFLTLSATATLIYFVGTEYDPAADVGVRWDTLPFQWPVAEPIMSARDQQFAPLESFQSPF